MESNRIIYLIAAVLVGWSITYLLRALPFILFSRKSKELVAIIIPLYIRPIKPMEQQLLILWKQLQEITLISC